MSKPLNRTGLYLLVGTIGLCALFPFYYAIITSLKSGSALFSVDYLPRHWNWDNYRAIFRQQPFATNIVNSVILASGVVFLSLLLSLTAAYALARSRFRGRHLLLTTILGVSMFPQVAVLSGMFELIRWLGLYNHLGGLVIAYLIFTLPFTVWVLTTFMARLPREIEEAAIMDGAGPLTIIWRIFLPPPA